MLRERTILFNPRTKPSHHQHRQFVLIAGRVINQPGVVITLISREFSKTTGTIDPTWQMTFTLITDGLFHFVTPASKGCNCHELEDSRGLEGSRLPFLPGFCHESEGDDSPCVNTARPPAFYSRPLRLSTVSRRDLWLL